MKKVFSILFLALSLNFLAQAPQKMSYQAIVRNSSNQLVQTSSVGLKISILQNSSSGNIIYSETHLPTTNENGAFSIEIGTGNIVLGTFNAIDWKTGEYWLQTEVDPLGGTNYSITAVSQFLSVPYAFNSDYAKISGNGVQNVSDNGDGTLIFTFENGSTYTTAELSGLQGQTGGNGQDGISVTNSFIQNDSLFLTLSNNQTINAGYVRGLQGLAGINGQDGAPGLAGSNGQNGVSIVNSYIQSDSLMITLSNGQNLNAGVLAGVSITNTVIQNDSLIVSLSNGQEINAGEIKSSNSDLFFPDGKNGSTILILPGTSYTVPQNKTLYLTFGHSDLNTGSLTINNDTTIFYLSAGKGGIIPESTVLTAGNNTLFTGILVEKGLEIINWNSNSPYTVPIGKTLYLTSVRLEITGSLYLNGVTSGNQNVNSSSSVLILPSSTILTWQNSYQNRQYIFTGYLK